ncbi:MAG TPA: GNAT family N-acetyltransferase [Solirubrobacteraceae bacterium]|nr:GNAT family N-acetyltransferase [Solirubrobacteraceae bacterium]
MAWPTAEPIETARLTLEPLRVDHAGEMVVVLADPRLYEFVGGAPPTQAQLRTRYALQVVGHSPDGRHGWLNWIVRERAKGAAVGTVQATLTLIDGRSEAEIAWVIGAEYQRRGYAAEAARAMVDWLWTKATHTIVAHIHPNHQASIGVARRLGLTPTDIIEGGETRWVAVSSPV